jgi:hypothetical protein
MPLVLAAVVSLPACEKERDSDLAVIEWLEREQERAELAQEVRLAEFRLAQAEPSAPDPAAERARDASDLDQRIAALGAREAALRQEIRALEADLLAHADMVHEIRMKRRAEALGTSFPSLVTRSGRTLVDVTVTSVTDSGITIRHRDGLVRLDFPKLTPAQRDFFGIEEVAAGEALAEERRREADLIAWGEREMAEAAAREQAAQAAQAAALKAPPAAAPRLPAAAVNPAPFPTPERPERYHRAPSTVYYYSVYPASNRCVTPRRWVSPFGTGSLGIGKPVPGQPPGILRPATVRPATVRPAAIRPATIRPAAVRPVKPASSTVSPPTPPPSAP